MTAAAETWVAIAAAGRVYDIGQLSADMRRALDAAAKRGEIIKEKVLWPNPEWGICIKTAWSKP